MISRRLWIDFERLLIYIYWFPEASNQQQPQPQTSMNPHATNYQESNSGHSHTLVHKQRSDITVEWSDSMNDVSLTGYFLNDMQSPEKSSNNNNKTMTAVASVSSLNMHQLNASSSNNHHHSNNLINNNNNNNNNTNNNNNNTNNNNNNSNSNSNHLALNESSRDSIIFNMDTIMDILPANRNEFEESNGTSAVRGLETHTQL